MLRLVPVWAGPKRNYPLFLPRPKNSIRWLGININCTLKESPIHHQNYIGLKTKGAILLGDVGKRKIMGGGGGCFDEFIDSLDPVVRVKLLY